MAGFYSSDMKCSSVAVRTSAKRPADLHSRPPFERMMRLHEKLKAGSFPHFRQLAEELEASTNTILPDIGFMRDSPGYRLTAALNRERRTFTR
jgi:hypothetical protein